MMENRMLLIGPLLCLVCATLAQDSNPANRLPTSVTPLDYFLHLKPDMDSNTVTGTVKITFNTTSNQSMTVSSVVLHLGVDVTVDEESVSLQEFTGQMKTIGAIEYDDANTLIKMVLPEGDSLQYNQMYMISLHFTSLLYSEPTGLFTGMFNSTSKYIASNFRPTFARNVFPCFDEPQLKTPVTLQVLRPKTYSAVSTAPLDSSKETTTNDLVLDTFMATPPIPLHSLGLFISEVSPVDSPMGVSLYAPPGTPAAVPSLQSLLRSITTTVGPFPISPLKLVVLPDQLKMHLASYGFVFTSTDIYGYNEQEPSYAAHVWTYLRLQLTEAFLRQFLEFSKTPQWWSHMWLSEGVGAFLAAHMQPEVSPWLKVVTRSVVLRMDGYPSQPVIYSQISSHWDIEKAVARQSVRNKGLSVLTMWNDTLPEGVVFKTIIDYIQLPKSVVTTNDFLSLLMNNIKTNKTYDVTPAIAELPLWLNTTGYPTVTYLPQTDNSFQLTQRPMFGNTTTNSKFWPVSVSFSQNSSQDWNNYRRGLWLLNASSSFAPGGSFSGKQWVILNLESGLYRVDYYKSWETILDALKSDLHPSTTPDSVKATVQDDAVALSLQGSLPFSTAFAVLNSTQRYKLDWFPVAKAFAAFTNKIGNDEDIYDEFRMFAATLFPADLLAMLDLQDRSTDPRMQYVRSVMTPWLCEFNISNCRQVVAELFSQLLLGDTNKIDPGDVENVACYGAQYNSSVLASLITAYTNSSSPQLRHLYSIGLGCLSDTSSVQRVLNLLINSTSPIATSDAKRILVSLASKIANSATITDFVFQQASTIQIVLGSGCLGDVLHTLGKLRIKDMAKIQSLANDQSLDPYISQSALRAISRTNASSAWWSANAADLDAALPQLHKRTTTTTPTTTSTPEASTSVSTASTSVSVPVSTATSRDTTVTTPSTNGTTVLTSTTSATTTSATTATVTNGTTAVTTNGTTAVTTNGTTAVTTNGTSPTTYETTSATTGSTPAPSSCPESLSSVKVFALVLSSVLMVLSTSL